MPKFDLLIPSIMENLTNNPGDLIQKVEADEDMKKDRRGSLTLANAGKGLPSPKENHHIPCKGLVYDKDTGRVVSLPYPKMFNMGECEDNITLTNSLLNDPEVLVWFPRKEDGTLIQVFGYGGEIYFSTRGVLEGSIGHQRLTNGTGSNDDEVNPNMDFIEEAKRILDLDNNPKLKEDLQHLTLIFELICPESKVVTNYGSWRKLILTGVINRSVEPFFYTSFPDLVAYAKLRGLEAVERLMPPVPGPQAMEKVLFLQKWEHDLLEGSVLQFEKDGKVLHRVKVKTNKYLRTYRILHGRKEADIAADLLIKPGLTVSWEAYVGHLKELIGEEPDFELVGQIQPLWQKWTTRILDSMDSLKNLEAEASRLKEATGGDMKAFSQAVQDYEQNDKSALFMFARGKAREAHRNYLRHKLPDGDSVKKALEGM